MQFEKQTRQKYLQNNDDTYISGEICRETYVLNLYDLESKANKMDFECNIPRVPLGTGR